MNNKTISKLIVITLLTVWLAACSLPPKVKTPRGEHRVPVNTAAELAAFETAVDDDYHYYQQLREQDELKASIVDLKQQVIELKKRIQQNNTVPSKPASIGKNNPGQLSTVTAPVAPAIMAAKKSQIIPEKEWMDSQAEKQAAPIAKNKRLAKLLKDPKNLVKIRDENVIFTANFGADKKDFTLSSEMKSALLDLAKGSENIEIRGYTDSNQDSTADNEIALARAVSAYDFLVANGVPANHIYVSYEGSGSFVADNTTAEGRARNRRVEIEIVGTNVSYFH